MKLYHTGKMIIRDPDLTRGRKNADFGQGFYLTPDMEFAYRWAGTDAVVVPAALGGDHGVVDPGSGGGFHCVFLSALVGFRPVSPARLCVLLLCCPGPVAGPWGRHQGSR